MAIGFFAFEAYPAVLNAIARAGFPYADNQWSEGPLLLQLHRLATGGPTYTPTPLANAYDYGPLYLFVLGGIRKLLSLPDGIVAYRVLSMCLGVLSLVPLGFAGIAIAQRAGIGGTSPARLGIAVGTALLGLAVLARCITFDSLHPDSLAFLVIATALALHFAIAARMLPPTATWALTVVGVAAAFGKQNAVVVVPLLLAGLAGARIVTVRQVVAPLGTLIAAIVALIVAMPPDMRAWTLFVPLGQPYELWAPRLADCVRFLTYWQPYLAVGFIAAGVALIVLGLRTGPRGLAIDAAALAAVAVVAFTGYFKTLGIWNNLAVLGLGTAPYAGALLGFGFGWRTRAMGRLLLASAGFASLLALGIALRGGEKQVPDAQIDRELSAVKALAGTLCATKQTIVVTVFPEPFLDCPTAQFALGQSYLELQTAYPRYYAGPTVFDRPIDARYVVIATAVTGPPGRLGLPAPWAHGYTNLVKRLVVVQGWGANYFPVELRVFEHR